jgi:hypothetical protein
MFVCSYVVSHAHRFWPECEVPIYASDVGSREDCGRDVLALSLTGFDPKRSRGFKFAVMRNGARRDSLQLSAWEANQ